MNQCCDEVKVFSEVLCHTCADDAVLGELLGQRLHVGVTVGVQLPAGDAQVEAQPRRMAVAAAVPLDVLVLFLAGTQPGGDKGGCQRDVCLAKKWIYKCHAMFVASQSSKMLMILAKSPKFLI